MRGATQYGASPVIKKILFQSTHPMRGATGYKMVVGFDVDISIHAPHAGCDPDGTSVALVAYKFQSTHPMRGAT